MSGLESDDLQNNATAGVVSQSDQPTGPRILPPFTGKLSVDKKLKFRRESFKQTIHDTYQNRDTTHLSQLTAGPPFSTCHLLAQIASKAFRDYERGETEAEYETRLALPDGWMLLTTASKSGKTNL
jgi:hypothetical protein